MFQYVITMMQQLFIVHLELIQHFYFIHRIVMMQKHLSLSLSLNEMDEIHFTEYHCCLLLSSEASGLEK